MPDPFTSSDSLFSAFYAVLYAIIARPLFLLTFYLTAPIMNINEGIA